jgi:hypothetical protein
VSFRLGSCKLQRSLRGHQNPVASCLSGNLRHVLSEVLDEALNLQAFVTDAVGACSKRLVSAIVGEDQQTWTTLSRRPPWRRHTQARLPAASRHLRRECARANDVSSTTSFGFARHSAMARCADVQFRDRLSRYPQGLSVKFIGGLSRVPYAALCRRARATPSTRWTFARSRPRRCGGAVCSRRRAMAAVILKSP